MQCLRCIRVTVCSSDMIYVVLVTRDVIILLSLTVPDAQVDRPDTGGAGLWVYQGASVEFQDKVVFRWVSRHATTRDQKRHLFPEATSCQEL